MSAEVKVGDTVHVNGCVTGVYPSGMFIVALGPNDTYVQMSAADIVHVEPRPLQVGDKVTWGTKFENWTLAAVHGEHAFVTQGDYALKVALADLVRVDEPPAPKCEIGVSTNCYYGDQRWPRHVDEPRPLQVGDRVKHITVSEAGIGVVKEIHDYGRVSVQYPTWYGMCRDEISKLRRV
jgi:hypothetical protein